MSVQDMIKAIINKDASAFETAFTETMGARVSAAVQDHFGLTTEEVELDEISQEKLNAYYDSAARDRKKAKAEVEKGVKQKRFTPQSVQKTADDYKRFVKRGRGMTAAANKMDEEVEQIDELSKKTLASYIRRASDSMAIAAHGIGKIIQRQEIRPREPLRLPPRRVRELKRKGFDVVRKRAAGIERATNKLKEEIDQLDELSPKTLGSYIHNATKNQAEIEKKRDRIVDQGEKLRDILEHPEKPDLWNLYKNANSHLGDSLQGLYNKSNKRYAGINRALNKLSGDKTKKD